ncbi:hypothetical protein L6250_03425 [Candidatus Parcubacteria bacterium]|nr:hypothetical protein [Patescibacteria group bacterium]MBU4466563.1 hypothetical protein [Patescibacteria group bacterium]MCG2688656.1 hypothetical protein [Candidatus Parcubacteria bacterium]
MAIKPTPPSPPKSNLPGKNIPVSEERLAAREKESLKPADEKEPKKADAEDADSEEATGEEKETKKTKEEGEERGGEGEEGEEEAAAAEETDEDEDEDEEDESQIEIAKSVKTGSSLLSPEGVIMLPLAILLDLVGIVLICFALDDFFITDIIGIATIGIWIFYKTGITPPAPESTGQKAEKIAKKAGEAAEKAKKIAAKAGKYGRLLRPILCMLGEVIVYIGWIPFWTYLVYKTLTDEA